MRARVAAGMAVVALSAGAVWAAEPAWGFMVQQVTAVWDGPAPHRAPAKAVARVVDPDEEVAGPQTLALLGGLLGMLAFMARRRLDG